MQWYFDFISPYAYLQSTRLEGLKSLGELECVPVLFAGLLDHWDNIGPAEIVPKRRATFRQIAYRAHREGIALTLPAEHPFNPLPLLRASQALGNEVSAVQRLFRFVWAEGHLPQDKQAFEALLSELGLSPADLANDTVKSALRENGTRAIEAGVFGVPTVAIGDELFWGDDAHEMAISYARSRGTEAVKQSDADGHEDVIPRWPSDAIRAADALPEGRGRSRIRTEQGNRDTESKPVSDSQSTTKAPRIPLLPPDLAEPAELVAQVRERRGGELLELDRLLLYSPKLAEGWNHMLGNIRTQLSIDMKLRELAMCVVAKVNRAEYEFFHHAPLWLSAGASQAQVDAIHMPDEAASNTELFDSLERAAIRLSVEMTRDVQVSDETFAACRRHLGEQQLVELVAVIGAYNLVSRFLVAFELHP